mmetsp:Transcript_18834/g.17988  ORF Transcript_18834/g.17988 Transcript_18834/m.17988 type:complete len:115 (+) Transcript_18834:340-684(+)
MAREHYGKWFVEPKNWNKVQKRAYKDNELERRRESPQEKMKITLKENSPCKFQDPQWGQMYPYQLMKSNMQNDFVVSKLIKQEKLKFETQRKNFNYDDMNISEISKHYNSGIGN